MKNFGWHVEYTVTLVVVFAAVLLFIPTSLQSTVQANLITRWKDCYDKLTYMQDVILKHEKSDILTSFKRAKTDSERKELFRQLVKPYFRLSDSKTLRRYRPKFMNKTKVPKDNLYYFTDFYLTDKKMIVGIKDVPQEENEEKMFLMMFDVNGLIPPNRWGKDIFGVRIYTDKVEALGQELSLPEMNSDCSAEGTGVACSYYYKIGGSFED